MVMANSKHAKVTEISQISLAGYVLLFFLVVLQPTKLASISMLGALMKPAELHLSLAIMEMSANVNPINM